ncbi:uncharacterized protein [Phyllobates terribilis]|uniref:uncharacterized protein n=1 Tax=Phyllobates terribilis TaxID=111132 RepID=UPI003CCB538A
MTKVTSYIWLTIKNTRQLNIPFIEVEGDNLCLINILKDLHSLTPLASPAAIPPHLELLATNRSQPFCPHPAPSINLAPHPISLLTKSAVSCLRLLIYCFTLHPNLVFKIVMEGTDPEVANRALNPLPLNQASLEGESFGSSCSTKDVSANDGDLDTITKSSIGKGHSDEASSDDGDFFLPGLNQAKITRMADWETRADAEPDELFPAQQLPEVSKISLQDAVEIPKRRGRGTFSYNKEALYSDQLAEESTNCDSEHQMFDDTTKQDLTVKNLSYGTRHVLVLDGFKPSYNTMNLENIFSNFKDKFAIRWVNDTVALAVFRSPSTAIEAYKSVNCGFSVRLLEEDDILIGSITGRELEPPKQRPQTSARTAQRLIAHGMGMKLPVSAGSDASKRVEEARKKRIIARQKLKDDAWGSDDD